VPPNAISTAEKQKFPERLREIFDHRDQLLPESPFIIVNLTAPCPNATWPAVRAIFKNGAGRVDAVLRRGWRATVTKMLEVLIDPLRLEAYDVTAAS